MKIQSGYQILSKIVYSITNTLTGCTNSNDATQINWGNSYSGTISASAGYTLTGATVSVYMGGTDITSSAYDSGTISITKVTGNIVISITAVDSSVPTVIITPTSQTAFSWSATDNVGVTDYAINTTGDAPTTWTSGSSGIYTVSASGTVYVFAKDAQGNIGSSSINVYSVTNSLTNCSSNNSDLVALANYGYSATISATSGYVLDTASVTMGGDDVTSTAYSNGTITIASVSGNIAITVSAEEQTIDTTFGNNSWETIARVSQTIASQNMTASDVYSNYGWSLGDTKDITLSTNETIQVQIIGINHDTLSSDHVSKAGLTLQMVNCLVTKYAMKDSNTNAGGWNGSKMRTTTLPTIKATLPSELQSVIKLVDKKSANGGSTNYSATVTSSDDLFLLAEIEIFGSITYAQDGVNEGTQYEYWVGKSANNRIKYYDNAGTLSVTTWWERSSRNDYTDGFCFVNNSGGAGKGDASLSRGVAFGFCV